MRQVVFLLFLLAFPAMHAQEGSRHDPVRANAHRVVRNGEPLYEMTVVGFVRATPEQAWQVLTDYERLPEFVPDLRSVKVLSRSGNTVRIEQWSSADILFVSHTVHMVLHIEESPRASIHVALIEGDMRHYDARWDIEPVSQADTRITFSGVMGPKFFVPPLIGGAILEASLKRTVEAVVAEIERRSMH